MQFLVFTALAWALAPAAIPAPRDALPVATAQGWLPVFLAAAAGAALVRWWPRRAAVSLPVVRLGRGAGLRPFGPGLPGVGDGPSALSVPAADRAVFAASLARALAARGPVLLLPRPEHRAGHWERFGPGDASVWLMEEERPTARRALTAAASLGTDGRGPALVIEGPGALEHVAGGSPVAALDELLRSTAVPTFVLVASGEPTPRGLQPVEIVASGEGWAAGSVSLVRRGPWIERAS